MNKETLSSEVREFLNGPFKQAWSSYCFLNRDNIELYFNEMDAIGESLKYCEEYMKMMLEILEEQNGNQKENE